MFKNVLHRRQCEKFANLLKKHCLTQLKSLLVVAEKNETVIICTILWKNVLIKVERRKNDSFR